MSTSRRTGKPREIKVADLHAVEIVAAILRGGGVVALPTDTVYGYAAAIDHDNAIERLYALKRRPGSKAIPILLSDEYQAERVVRAMPAAGMALASAYWPGALTMVLDAQDHLHPRLTSAENNVSTVAVRVPDHDFARTVIATLGGALAVTSANRSGESPALAAVEIEREGARVPDAIVDGGHVTGGIASTIVRLSHGHFAILRQGAIPATELALTLSRLGATPFPNHGALV